MPLRGAGWDRRGAGPWPTPADAFSALLSPPARTPADRAPDATAAAAPSASSSIAAPPPCTTPERAARDADAKKKKRAAAGLGKLGAGLGAGFGAVAGGVTAVGKGAVAGVAAVADAAVDTAATAARTVADPSTLKGALLNSHSRSESKFARGLRAANAVPGRGGPCGPKPIADTRAFDFRAAIPARPGLVIPAAAIMYAWMAGCALAVAWMLRRFSPAAPARSPLVWGALPGAVAGVLGAVLYHRRRERSRLLREVLNLVPGRKGLYGVLGSVPPWVSFQEREKAEWLNGLVSELWPYYDKAIAKAVRRAERGKRRAFEARPKNGLNPKNAPKPSPPPRSRRRSNPS